MPSASSKTVENGSRSVRSARTQKRNHNRSAWSGYWLRVCGIARAIITEIGKSAPSGEYYAYGGSTRDTHVSSADEPGPASKVLADPYGLIPRWNNKREGPVQTLPVGPYPALGSFTTRSYMEQVQTKSKLVTV